MKRLLTNAWFWFAVGSIALIGFAYFLAPPVGQKYLTETHEVYNEQ